MQMAGAGARVKVGQGTGKDRAIQNRTEQDHAYTGQDHTYTEQNRTGPYIYRTERDKTGLYYIGQKRLGQATDRKCRPPFLFHLTKFPT